MGVFHKDTEIAHRDFIIFWDFYWQKGGGQKYCRWAVTPVVVKSPVNAFICELVSANDFKFHRTDEIGSFPFYMVPCAPCPKPWQERVPKLYMELIAYGQAIGIQE